MNKDERSLARIMFKNKVLSSSGQAYEDLFCAVMSKAYSDFVPVKPQGRFGDRKNDGYQKETGTYYQVYAPEEPSENEAHAISKAEKDFEGLIKHWQAIYPIKEYHFVFNDKYKGPYPEVEKSLKNIKTENKLKKADVFLAKHLEDVLFRLDDDVIQSIIGFIPNPENITMIDYDSVSEVIGHIMQSPLPSVLDQNLVVPDYDEKISFNDLNHRVHTMLVNASYQVGFLDRYFESHGAAIKQDLRNHFSQIYQDLKQKGYDTIPEGLSVGDLIFFDILNLIAPQSVKPIQEAALVLMAKYFESCDIFEEPDTKSYAIS